MSLQRHIAKFLFGLPGGLLVQMAGGKPLSIEGRVLEPQLQLAAWNGRNAPPLSSLPAEVVQAAVNQQLALLAAKPEPGVKFEACDIQGREGHVIPARLYTPAQTDAAMPMMVYFHMGGGVVGDLETCHAWCSILAARTRGLVLSVDYRLAPLHVFPAGLNDCFDAYDWALQHAAERGAPAGKLAIGGDSMGGNFAAIMAQQLKAAGKPPVLQLLIYPAVDIANATPSKQTFGKTFSLSTDTMDWFMAQYLPAGQALTDLRLSPGLAADLSGLAPAIVITAGHDPLVDEGDAYAARLAQAGVPVTHKRYDTLSHAFTAFTDFSPGSRKACIEIADMVRGALTRA
jgi:acetyl esterase